MPARHGRDAEVRVAFRHRHRRPGVERVGVPEAALPEFVHRFGRCHDRHRLRQFSLCHLIEVIAVEVRQNNEIKRRQLVDIDGRIREPGGMQPVAQRDLFMHVDKGRIGQDGEPGVADQDGGIANKEDRACRDVRCRAA